MPAVTLTTTIGNKTYPDVIAHRLERMNFNNEASFYFWWGNSEGLFLFGNDAFGIWIYIPENIY